MRADRLLSMLMLLQTRGSLTAAVLAKELEVSIRTIYRDVQALSIAGVPVYTERGPGGGCTLLESYRTNLTGLSADEVGALFMLNIPAALDQLGVSQELKAALRKLSAALPSNRRLEGERSRTRIHLDSVGWFQVEEPVPCLAILQRALWQDRRLRLVFRAQFGTEVQQVVAPYGLVAKANTWYLVYDREDEVRAIRVGRISQAEILDEAFKRPEDFDLEEFWQTWCAEFEQNRPVFWVKARVSPGLLPNITHLSGERIRQDFGQLEPPDSQGWVTCNLPFESLEAARSRILGYGRAIEVLEPLALRRSVMDYAAQIMARYTERDT